MTLRRISPREAQELMDKEGYAYVDVRSVPEFEAGHPEGAFNVPILQLTALGLTPNPEFVAVMQGAFAKEARLILGCRAGGRSLQAANLLGRLGYTSLLDQRAGFEGADGEPGWRQQGLPIATAALPDRTWSGLKERLR